MLAVVVAAAISPNVGAVSTASNCPYNTCASSPAGTPTWEYASIAAVVVLALLVGLFVLMRRRRPPREEAAGESIAPWSGPPSPPTGATQEAPMPPVPPSSAQSSYVETPDDVGVAPPTLTPGPAAAAATAPAAEGEPDIDSLMAELDKISGEILKRTPKKAADESDDDPGSGASN